MSTRAKFRVTVNEPQASGEGNRIVMEAVSTGSPENESFFKYTPSGTLSMSIVNATAAAEMPVGQEVYLDFTPAGVIPEPGGDVSIDPPVAESRVEFFHRSRKEIGQAAWELKQATHADSRDCLEVAYDLWKRLHPVQGDGYLPPSAIAGIPGH